METIFFTKKDLEKAVSENLFWKGDFNTTPFSKNKAHWILENERIADDDYCTLVAIENKTLIALVNLIPDLFNVFDDKVEKMYWMSLWWVNESYKQTIIGPYLFNEAQKLTQNKIIGKAYAETANDFYEKQPFTPIISRERYTLFFCLDAGTAKNKFPFTRFLSPFLSVLETFSLSVISRLNYNKIKKTTEGLKYEYLNYIDDESWGFIEPFCKKDLVFKTKNYINWHLNPRQYVVSPVQSKARVNSQYSGDRHKINLTTIKIIEKGNMIGFISFLMIGREAHLKYFISSKKNEDVVVNVLMEHLITEKINYIFTDDSCVVKNITKRFTTLYVFSLLKKGIAHKDISDKLVNHQLKERDGHFM
ncbi:MAG: hypothetical protein ABJZ18_02360 [Algibacter sp.]